MSDDREIIEQIDQLVEEEHALETRHADQLWDLLRQRRARRNAGLDPDDASERDPKTVEGYRQ